MDFNVIVCCVRYLSEIIFEVTESIGEEQAVNGDGVRHNTTLVRGREKGKLFN